MLPHRSDTSQGHLHPPLALVLHCLLLPPLPSFSLPSKAPSRPHNRTAGVVSPVRPLMPPLSWGRLRKPTSLSSLSPVATLSLQLPEPLAAPVLSTHRSTMQRPLSTRQIFPPPSGTTLHPVAERSGRLHDFWNFRSCDRELLRCAREKCRVFVSGARKRRDRARFSPLAI